MRRPTGWGSIWRRGGATSGSSGTGGPLGREARAQVRRHHRARVVRRREPALAAGGDPVVDDVAQRVRDDAQRGGEPAPAAAELPEDVERRVRAEEQGAVGAL